MQHWVYVPAIRAHTRLTKGLYIIRKYISLKEHKTVNQLNQQYTTTIIL